MSVKHVKHVFKRLVWNSESNALEFQENLLDIFLHYYMLRQRPVSQGLTLWRREPL